MRTTLTLDDDVAAEIERLRRTRNANFKDLVNDALRRGLSDLDSGPRQGEPFQTRAVSLGRLRLASVDNIHDSLAIAEGETFK